MKKSELIKIIKEELQKQLVLNERSGAYGGEFDYKGVQKANDRIMIDLLRSCTTLLKQIAQNTSKAAPAPTNMSGEQ